MRVHELSYRDMLVSAGRIVVIPNRIGDGLIEASFNVVGDVLLNRLPVNALMGICNDVQVRLFPVWECLFLR